MSNYRKLYKKAKDFYFGLGKIRCPALDDEEIIFDWRGFRHFLNKDKGRRPIADQIQRFKLLNRIRFLINNSKLLSTNEKEENGTVLFSLSHGEGKEEIKVIILNDAQNKKYFISIMDHK